MAVMPAQKPHRSKQDYATPENFMVAMRKTWGLEFAIDFAADATNTKAPIYLTEQDDALSLPWYEFIQEGEWGWLNPPYTDIKPWAQRCAELKYQRRQVAFLVPASVGSNWFRDYVDGVALVLLLNGRLAFMPNKPTWLYPKDCILCLYSPHIAPGYEVWPWR